MSNRVMSIIQAHNAKVEMYSIDEAFFHCTDHEDDALLLMKKLKNTVEQWTGIPVCIGVGQTKTLAKIANHVAKKSRTGIFCLNETNMSSILKKTPVHDIWGVGSRFAEKLKAMKIQTAWQLYQAPESLIRERFNVVMSRTQNELKGVSCLALEEIEPDRKQIVCSRSFGSTVSHYNELAQAASNFVHRATEKMRKRNLEATLITVTINTNPYCQDKQYHQSGTIRQVPATASTRVLMQHAMAILQKIYQPDYQYKRAGVILSELSRKEHHQQDLFNDKQDDKLAIVMDEINQRFGRDTIVPGRLAGSYSQWKMHQNHLSNTYTTDWTQLMKVR